MARPLRAIPTQRKEVYLPVHLIEKLDLLLFDPITGRVPYNAYAKLITPTLERNLHRRAAEQQVLERSTVRTLLAGVAQLLADEGYSPGIVDLVYRISEEVDDKPLF